MNEPLGYALIGCGSFGRFCLDQYKTMPELKLVAAADIDTALCAKVANRFGMVSCETVGEVFARDDVDIVHIATPPFTHTETVHSALQAGKHVLCEKPLTTNLDEARMLEDTARDAGLVLSVNLIMRYDPLSEIVKKIIDEKLLGDPLHGFFENYAQSEGLGPEHWFWNRKMSGGIFIEHAVHFFDLFRWWFGEGDVCAGQETRLTGTDIVEQVHCTVSYGDVLVNFYHGFTQAERMDRQEIRILFERGTVRLFEWVPTTIEIDAMMDTDTYESIKTRFTELRDASQLNTYYGDERHIANRGKEYDVDGRYKIVAGVGMTKPELYSHVVRGLMADQIAGIHDPAHERLITERNGVSSLEMAVNATELARTPGDT